jgi:hypothetical protein
VQDRQLDAESVFPPFALVQRAPLDAGRPAIRSLQMQDSISQIFERCRARRFCRKLALLGETSDAGGEILRSGRLPSDEGLFPVRRVFEQRDEALGSVWSTCCRSQEQRIGRRGREERDERRLPAARSRSRARRFSASEEGGGVSVRMRTTSLRK